MQKKHLLWVIFILIALTRLSTIDYIYSEDEMILPLIYETQADPWVNTDHHSHPPLGQIIIGMFSSVFGTSTIAMRALPILFSIMNIYLIYLIARKLYDSKTAFIAATLSLISFHMLVTSNLVSIDQFVLTLILAFIYLVGKEEKFGSSFYIKTGILLGFSMLMKYQMIVLYPVLSIYLLRLRGLKDSFMISMKASLVSLAIFAIFPLASYITNFSYFLETIGFLFTFTDGGLDLPFATSLIMLILWTTPLFIILSIFQAIRLKKEDYLHLVLIITVLLFNLFVVKHGDYSRYFIVILPSIMMMSANYLRSLDFKKKDLKVLGLSTIFVLAVCYAISKSTLKTSLFGLQYPSFYFQQLVSFNLNFFYPFHVDHGYWVGVNFILLALAFSLTAIAGIVYFFKKGHKIGKLSLILLLSLGIGFNIYLDSEYLYHVTQPDPDSTIKSMISYYHENDLPSPIYTTDKAFLYAAGTYDDNFKRPDGSLRIDDLDVIQDSIDQKGGTILYLRFSPYFTQEEIFALQGCTKEKTFISKGIDFGQVLVCSPRN